MVKKNKQSNFMVKIVIDGSYISVATNYVDQDQVSNWSLDNSSAFESMLSTMFKQYRIKYANLCLYAANPNFYGSVFAMQESKDHADPNWTFAQMLEATVNHPRVIMQTLNNTGKVKRLPIRLEEDFKEWLDLDRRSEVFARTYMALRDHGFATSTVTVRFWMELGIELR